MSGLPTHFSHLLIGTSLPLSILAAALASSGQQVLHVDPGLTYGSHHASLSIPDLLLLAASPPPWLLQPELEVGEEVRRRGREYAIVLEPMLLLARGGMVDELVKSGGAAQAGFQLVQGSMIVSPSSPSPSSSPAGLQATPVPSSKESVFSSSSLSLLEKRTLMRFLLWVSSSPSAPNPPAHPALTSTPDLPLAQFLRDEFKLPPPLVQALTYAVALCSSPTDPALPALQRIRHHLLSAGRYGPSPYLLGHYGGPGELAQLFCRMAAVHGTPYVLGHAIQTLLLPSASTPASITLSGIEETFTADRVVLEPSFLPPPSPPPSPSIPTLPGTYRAHCIAILSHVPQELDTALLVFPPGVLGPGSGEVEVEGGLEGQGEKAVVALWTGEGGRSCPAGQYILYLSCPSTSETSARDLLEPYLRAFLALTPHPAQLPSLTFFYTLRCTSPRAAADVSREVQEGVWVVDGPGGGLVDGAERGAGVVRELWGVLGGGGEGRGMWDGVRERQRDGDEDDDDGEEGGPAGQADEEW